MYVVVRVDFYRSGVKRVRHGLSGYRGYSSRRRHPRNDGGHSRVVSWSRGRGRGGGCRGVVPNGPDSGRPGLDPRKSVSGRSVYPPARPDVTWVRMGHAWRPVLDGKRISPVGPPSPERSHRPVWLD